MNADVVAEFLMKVDENEALRNELGTALEGKDEQAQAVVEVAARHGFEFTAEEYSEVIGSLTQLQEGALSDDELEAVAGGVLRMPAPSPQCGSRRQLQNIGLKRGAVFYKM